MRVSNRPWSARLQSLFLLSFAIFALAAWGEGADPFANATHELLPDQGLSLIGDCKSPPGHLGKNCEFKSEYRFSHDTFSFHGGFRSTDKTKLVLKGHFSGTEDPVPNFFIVIDGHQHDIKDMAPENTQDFPLPKLDRDRVEIRFGSKFAGRGDVERSFLARATSLVLHLNNEAILADWRVQREALLEDLKAKQSATAAFNALCMMSPALKLIKQINTSLATDLSGAAKSLELLLELEKDCDPQSPATPECSLILRIVFSNDPNVKVSESERLALFNLRNTLMSLPDLPQCGNLTLDECGKLILKERVSEEDRTALKTAEEHLSLVPKPCEQLTKFQTDVEKTMEELCALKAVSEAHLDDWVNECVL